MAVPAEDQRDYDFAKAYDLPIVRTIQPPDDWDGEAYNGDGPHINSDWLNGLDKPTGIARAIEQAQRASSPAPRMNGAQPVADYPFFITSSGPDSDN